MSAPRSELTEPAAPADPTPILVAGATGAMGRAVGRAVRVRDDVVLAGALVRSGAPDVGRDAAVLFDGPAFGVPVTDDPSAALRPGTAVVDFSTPAVSVALAEAAANAGAAHIIGTTGFSDDDESRIANAAARAAIVKSGNMSLGINLLTALVERAARALPERYDIEIVEAHHRRKVDAPSGTALMLGDAAARGRASDLGSAAATDRANRRAARKPHEIGLSSVRGGGVVGDHDVLFLGDDEALVLKHRAFDRSLFADGALTAARWATGRAPGLYSMRDVLGL